jgi:hypothetical protein
VYPSLLWERLYALCNPGNEKGRDSSHPSDYQRWREALDVVDQQAYQRIHDALHSRFSTREVDTSSWIPGSDWTDTVFQPLWVACGEDPAAAALFFGLIVWQVVMDRSDCWSFGRYEKEGVAIKGMTYFRISCPESA